MFTLRWRCFGAFSVLALVLLVPFLIDDPYFLHIGTMVLLNCVLAVSLFPLLRTGLLSVAHAAFMALGAYFSALVVMRLGVNFWIAMPLSGIFTSVVAVAVGIPVLRTKGMVFMLITFSFNEVMRLIINNWRSLTGGPGGISQIPSPNPWRIDGLFNIEFTSRPSSYYIALALAIATIVVVKLLWSSRFGRTWRGIEEADDLAESIGVNVLNYKILIFAVSCFFAGVAGSFYAHYYRFLSPVDFGIWQSIYPLVYLQVGGVASIAGPVAGAIVLTILPELFTSLTVFQPMMFGGFILITMLLFPPGLIGIPQLLLARKGRKETGLKK